jgi:hypothetical protein
VCRVVVMTVSLVFEWPGQALRVEVGLGRNVVTGHHHDVIDVAIPGDGVAGTAAFSLRRPSVIA